MSRVLSKSRCSSGYEGISIIWRKVLFEVYAIYAGVFIGPVTLRNFLSACDWPAIEPSELVRPQSKACLQPKSCLRLSVGTIFFDGNARQVNPSWPEQRDTRKKPVGISGSCGEAFPNDRRVSAAGKAQECKHKSPRQKYAREFDVDPRYAYSLGQ